MNQIAHQLHFAKDCLYKAFQKQKYADDFLKKGKIKFSQPDVFARHVSTWRNSNDLKKQMEDIAFNENAWRIKLDEHRTDVTEGYGIYRTEGGRQARGISLNPTYIFCCSGSDLDLDVAKKKFGRFIVRINDPERLRDAVGGQIAKKYKLISGPEWCQVAYDKGERLIGENTFPEEVLCQKPKEYADEKEVRLLFELEVL